MILAAGKTAYAMLYKDGATTSGLPEMLRAEEVVAEVWGRYGYTATVTSGTDSHQPGDVHTLGVAEDFRTHDIEDRATKLAMILQVKTILEREGYWLLFEDEGTANEHLHIQFNG